MKKHLLINLMPYQRSILEGEKMNLSCGTQRQPMVWILRVDSGNFTRNTLDPTPSSMQWDHYIFSENSKRFSSVKERKLYFSSRLRFFRFCGRCIGKAFRWKWKLLTDYPCY